MGTGEASHVLAELTDRIRDTLLDPEAILNAVTSALSRLRRGTWVAYLIGKDPRHVKLVAANEREPQLARYLEELHRSGEASGLDFHEKVIDTGEPLLMPSVTRDEFLGMLREEVHSYLTRKAPPVMAPWRDVGIMLVPMRARGATVGSLGVFESRPAAPFSAVDVEWLQPIADQTGLAIDNAQLYADSNRRLERLAAMRTLAMTLAASGDLRLTVQLILDRVLASFRVDAADVMLVDQADGSLVSAGYVGFRSTSVPEYRLELSELVQPRLNEKPRVQMLSGGALSQFKRRTLFAREGFRSYCAAPLISRGRQVGVLEILHRSALEVDDEWLAFLDTLAGITAMAVDNNEMADALRRAAPAAKPATDPKLTQLERRVLSLVVEGTTNSAIADALHISQSTVKFHVRQILQKVGAGNRTELARLATREGWT